MLFSPFNFTFSLERVAVYEWEPVPPADTPPPPVPTAASCDDLEAQKQPQLQDLLLPAMHLVFKGYEWASVANCGLFPRPSFEDCYSGGADVTNEQADGSDDERHARRNEGAHRLKPAVTAPDRANPADSSCSTDALKPRQR
jgi:hypothetical protein